jgi:sulfhydrogenase subunit beta (sulfur reductase)
MGPVMEDGHCVLKEVNDLSAIDLTSIRTILPFKKYLFPPKFSMFSFKENKYISNLSEISKRVIFGLHPCDIHALLIMDEFHSKYYIDPYYVERRKKTVIIGFSCIPDIKCFCHATNTDSVEEGFDLFLTDLDDFFLVWVGSSVGDDILRTCPEIIDENIEPKDLKKYILWQQKRKSKFAMNIDLTAMTDIMELSYDSPIWEEEGEKCLSCGACTIVCPTCPCFNIIDELKIGKKEGKRFRQWDSCLFKEYSMVAGEHNFRAKRSHRLKLRFTHKLQAFVGQFGKPACVGCGRCIGTCPVNIDIETIAKRLQGEEINICG